VDDSQNFPGPRFSIVVNFGFQISLDNCPLDHFDHFFLIVHSCLGLRSTFSKNLANVSSFFSIHLFLCSTNLTHLHTRRIKMLFPVLAPSISASSSRSSDSAAPPPRRVASTETTTSSRSLSNWFSGLKRRNSYDLEEKLVKAVTKLDRREREKREKAMKKHEKEQKLKMRKEQVCLRISLSIAVDTGRLFRKDTRN